MNINPNNFYNYFRDCYRLDYREFSVDNILSSKHPFKWFVKKKEELFNENLPYIPYDNPKITDLELDLELNKLEKKLFYGCFFVLGKSENPLIKDTRICAPLLLFPATIVTVDDLKFLEIDVSSFIINRSILYQFDDRDETKTKDLFIEEVTENIGNNFGNTIWLKNVLDQYFSNIITEELSLYPNVWSSNKIKTFFGKNKPDDQYNIIPAAGTVLVNRAESSLQVLNDLKEIASRNEFNSSLQELLNQKTSKEFFTKSYLRSRLNIEQYRSLQKSYQYKNSIIIGPPGTGKSYTITSIILDAVIKGKSILVVSKTKQAVEVLRKMLQDDFKLKDYLVHTTGNKYKFSLMSKIGRYLSGITSRSKLPLNEEKIENINRELLKLEEKFRDIVDRELERADVNFNDKLSFYEHWRKLLLNYWYQDNQEIWTTFDRINELSENLEKLIKTYSKRKIKNNIHDNSKIHRKDISLFYDSLDSSSFTEYKKILSEVKHENILRVFPIWLSNLTELNAVLPLKKDLFDLVIIDESTQCDIASALPAIYRAKKAVIVGDPNQLRHYSFVSKRQQENLRIKYQLPEKKIFDYRNKSILDLYLSLVEDQDQITFLREHFRSTPSLIEFSNKYFYDGQLEILKSTPKHTTNSQIELIEVNGRRNTRGENEIEAKALLQKLDELITEFNESKNFPSIGIISLFNSQVSFLNRLLKEKYDLNTMKKFDLFCGTPYSFQGTEREIVLLSFNICDESHHSALIHANKPEVLNVAITRAKSFQYVFKSISDKKLDNNSLVAQYFNFVRNFTHYKEEAENIDMFQEEVGNALKKLGFKNLKYAYPVAGSLLDILVVHEGKNYFIDLIGYPGSFKEAFSLERYETLGRTGIKSMPIHYSYWKENRKMVFLRLKKFFGQL